LHTFLDIWAGGQPLTRLGALLNACGTSGGSYQTRKTEVLSALIAEI
jgi:hypothetical protein